ncbi:hypothetical protein [Microbacterium deminutum]|uniref:Uncharacterized protein n=1 Tax=Microbacterium deminutum TaxID=344164 RepID=A0ABN2QZ41_9MICO
MITPRVVVRIALAVAICAYAFTTVLPWLMIVAYRSEWMPVLIFLGNATAGDDWHTFLPLLRGTPGWVVGIMIAATALLLMGGALAILGSPVGPWMLVVASALTLVQVVVLHADPAYGRIFLASGEAQDWLAVAVLAALTAVAFGALRRPGPRTPRQSLASRPRAPTDGA